jgi:hypothetical protein
MTGLMRDRELEAALLDIYDTLPGPMFSLLDDDTRRIMVQLAKDRNPNAGRGRVTSQRLDMRLKHNRDAREQKP